MVVNNLLIRLKQRDPASVAQAAAALQKLRGQIPVLLESRVETDVKGSAAGYDIMLINTFPTAGDIQAYLEHPVHVEAAAYITQVIDQSASFCYEV